MTFRDPTVAELIEQLREMPQHYPVTVIVNGTAGVITGVWRQPLDLRLSDVHVLIGEQHWKPPTVPAEWIADEPGSADD